MTIGRLVQECQSSRKLLLRKETLSGEIETVVPKVLSTVPGNAESQFISHMNIQRNSITIKNDDPFLHITPINTSRISFRDLYWWDEKTDKHIEVIRWKTSSTSPGRFFLLCTGCPPSSFRETQDDHPTGLSEELTLASPRNYSWGMS